MMKYYEKTNPAAVLTVAGFAQKIDIINL